MSKVIGALIAACAVAAGLVGCAAPPSTTRASPSPGKSPEQAAPSESPASDSCANLSGDDVQSAIATLPGWSYDLWSTSEALDGTQQGGNHSRAEYVAPDRLRAVGWDPASVRHGQIFIGDRMWWYLGLPESSRFDPADSGLAESEPSSRGDFATALDRVFPLKGPFGAHDLTFPGDLPGDGLRESPRVADTECLATDPNTGISLVTTRSGQLVRMTSEKRAGNFIELTTLMFRAAMPPAIEPPTVTDLKSKPFVLRWAKPRATDPR